MPTDGEITFADHAGRFYARRFGMAPMVGRLIGYLAVCDPREQTISELADALLASRSAIAGAVNVLENLGLIRRSRAAGERMDRVRIDMSSSHAMGFDVSEYREMAELAREGRIEPCIGKRRGRLVHAAAREALVEPKGLLGRTRRGIELLAQ